jgi:hypothetical protein
MATTTTGVTVLYAMNDGSVRPALVVGVLDAERLSLVVYRADVRHAQSTPPRTPDTWHTLAENSQDKQD